MLLRRRASRPAPEHLDAARPGQSLVVRGYDQADPVLADRLQDLGLQIGATVQCLRIAPLGSPLMFRAGNADLCLRRDQARQIQAALA